MSKAASILESEQENAIGMCWESAKNVAREKYYVTAI